MSSYRIGTAANNKTEIDLLGIINDPQPALAHYAEYVRLGDGTTRGAGWLQCEWRWKYITYTEIAFLRAYCAGVSAAVHIVTPNTDGTFAAYSATMNWPQIPEPLHGSYLDDFVIEFTEMILTGGVEESVSVSPSVSRSLSPSSSVSPSPSSSVSPSVSNSLSQSASISPSGSVSPSNSPSVSPSSSDSKSSSPSLSPSSSASASASPSEGA